MSQETAKQTSFRCYKQTFTISDKDTVIIFWLIGDLRKVTNLPQNLKNLFLRLK